MSDVSHRILIGAYGWRHQGWQDAFYPDDLPQDWQLGYYSNEFPVVMIPAAYWQQGDEAIEEALEDSAETLRIVYEAPVILQHETVVTEVLSTLDVFTMQNINNERQGVALVIPANSVDFPFAELLAHLDLTIPIIFSFAPEVGSEQIASLEPMLKDYGAGLCWNGGDNAEVLQLGQVALTIIQQQLDMPQLRKVIETILANTSAEQESVLIFQGEPPAIDLMHNADVMLGLF